MKKAPPEEDGPAAAGPPLGLRDLVEAIPFLAWVADNATDEIFYNQRFFDFHGLPRGAPAPDWQSFIHPDDLPAIFAAHVKISTTGEPSEGEFRVRGAGGAYRWHLLKAHGIKDAAGRVVYRLGTAVDVHDQRTSTERALALQTLSAALLKAASHREVVDAIVAEAGRALGASAVGLLWRSADGRSLELVGSAGYTDELRRRFATIPIDADIAVAACVREGALRLYPTRETWLRQYPMIEPRPQHRAFAAIPLFKGPEAVGAITLSYAGPQEFDADYRSQLQIVSDECALAIARSALLEEQALYSAKVIELHAITSHLSRAVTEAEVREVIRARVFRTFHADRGALFELAPDADVLRPIVSSGYPDELAAHHAALPVSRGLPVCLAFRDGEPLFIEDLAELRACDPEATALADEAGTQAMAVLPLRHDRRKLGVIQFAYGRARAFPETTRHLMRTLALHCADALERARLYDVSERAVKARDNLISVSAHELLTPISGSKLQMLLLLRKLDQGRELPREAIRKIAAQTDRNLDRLTKLVGDMLDLSRISLGKLTIEAKRCDLGRVVTEAVERALPMLAAARCELRRSIAPAVWALVDPYRIEQVVTNLLSNACRYAHGRPVEVRLVRAGEVARLVVADQGIGIRKEDQARIFERFERATSLDERAGLGLGLFIVRQIVEAHGGSVAVESEPGAGAAFVIGLPAALDAEGAE